MEKNCLNCKWYWNKECHNSGLELSLGSGESFVDDGLLQSSIEEIELHKKLFNCYLEELDKLGVIKKNKPKGLNIDEKIESLEIYYNEFLDIELSPIISKAQEHVDLMCNIKNPSDFSCNNWE